MIFNEFAWQQELHVYLVYGRDSVTIFRDELTVVYVRTIYNEQPK